MSEPTVGNYNPGAGVIVGTDTPQASQFFNPNLPVQQQLVSHQQFSAEDIARARAQEKDKLYPQLEELKAELGRLRAERDAQVALEAEHRATAEAAALAANDEARRKAEAEMDARTLLEQTRAEFELKFEQLHKERELQSALLQKEQQLRELVTYREQAKAAAVDTIHPTLVDLVDGSTFAEIDASIARLQEKSAIMLEEVRQEIASNRAAQPGVRAYGGPAGVPLETYSEHETDPADVANWTMAEYMKNRDKLLAQTRSDRGLFG